MNQKAFASIFIGLLMFFSAFAGMMLLWGNNGSQPVKIVSTSPETFGVRGRLVEWNFNSLSDMLEMAPESTVAAYWLNNTASQNLTDVARAVLPQSFGLSYGNKLYPNNIERLGTIYFNDTWSEFHWIKPFPLNYEGLVIPYEDYMIIPAGSDYSSVMGKPALFGPEDGLKGVLDVISGGLPTNKFSMPLGEQADLQVDILGASVKDSAVPLPSGFKELYLAVSPNNEAEGYRFTAKYLNPDSSIGQKTKSIADQYNLSLSSSGGMVDVSGTIKAGNLKDVLSTFLKP
jgi:hypothetical protein